MEIIKTLFDGLLVIKPTVFADRRGKCFEAYQREYYRQIGITCDFIRDYYSYSIQNVLRGLHGQRGDHCMLVQVLHGKAMDVVVDIRPNSKTFKQHCFNELSEGNQHQVFIPNGFIHGFYAVSERVVFHYKCSSYYDPSLEFGYRYDDPSFAISWPHRDFIISERDQKHPYFSETA